jgi:hypothetical protein
MLSTRNVAAAEVRGSCSTLSTLYVIVVTWLMSVPDAVPEATAGCIIKIKAILHMQMANRLCIKKAILINDPIPAICAQVTEKRCMHTNSFEEEYEI